MILDFMETDLHKYASHFAQPQRQPLTVSHLTHLAPSPSSLCRVRLHTALTPLRRQPFGKSSVMRRLPSLLRQSPPAC